MREERIDYKHSYAIKMFMPLVTFITPSSKLSCITVSQLHKIKPPSNIDTSFIQY